MCAKGGRGRDGAAPAYAGQGCPGCFCSASCSMGKIYNPCSEEELFEVMLKEPREKFAAESC